MTLTLIQAAFECDGCGAPFRQAMDPATKCRVEGWSLYEYAVDAVRGAPDVSVQHDMVLCARCTRVADSIGAEDYVPTRDEVRHAIDQDGLKDPRPARCRFRLEDEGKPYPRSGCTACGATIATGLGKACRHSKSEG